MSDYFNLCDRVVVSKPNNLFDGRGGMVIDARENKCEVLFDSADNNADIQVIVPNKNLKLENHDSGLVLHVGDTVEVVSDTSMWLGCLGVIKAFDFYSGKYALEVEGRETLYFSPWMVKLVEQSLFRIGDVVEICSVYSPFYGEQGKVVKKIDYHYFIQLDECQPMQIVGERWLKLIKKNTEQEVDNMNNSMNDTGFNTGDRIVINDVRSNHFGKVGKLLNYSKDGKFCVKLVDLNVLSPTYVYVEAKYVEREVVIEKVELTDDHSRWFDEHVAEYSDAFVDWVYNETRHGKDHLVTEAMIVEQFEAWGYVKPLKVDAVELPVGTIVRINNNNVSYNGYFGMIRSKCMQYDNVLYEVEFYKNQLDQYLYTKEQLQVVAESSLE